jgi:hypothetical protein
VPVAATSSASSSSTPQQQRSVRFILLDSRFFQDSAADDMLGAAQWAWLEKQVHTSEPTDLFVLTSGVQLVSTDKRIGEGWRLLPRSRARIFEIFASRTTNRDAMVLFLSGDVHLAETAVTYWCTNDTTTTAAAAGGSSNSGGADTGTVTVHPFTEATSSGMTHSVSSQTGQVVADLVLKHAILDDKDSWAEREFGAAEKGGANIRGFMTTKNVADVAVDWEKEVVTVTYVDENGADALVHRLPFASLRSRRGVQHVSELPALVRTKCAEESLRAISAPMLVLPGVVAGALIVLGVLGAPALAVVLCVVAFRRRNSNTSGAVAAGQSKSTSKKQR